MEKFYFNETGNGKFSRGYLGIRGEIITRTRDDYPYSYDPYLIYGRPCIISPSENYYFNFVYSDRVKELNDFTYTQRKNPILVGEILSRVFNKAIVIEAIAEGANQATGYPYFVYAFKIKKEPSTFNEGLFVNIEKESK